MQAGVPSKTAQSVALRRAEHQFFDWPHVFDDPIAPRIIGGRSAACIALGACTAQLPPSRYLRAFVAARSRYAEDQLARAIAAGAKQYVILGAGLDTFAYRNPYPSDELRVFEVDHPDSQALKRRRLEDGGIRVPASVAFVPVDFERQELRAELERAGFRAGEPAFFSWLGGTLYLERETVMATFSLIHSLCAENAVCFDYGRSREALSAVERVALDALGARVGLAGEPLRSLFDPDELAADLKSIGFRRIERPSTDQINALYFRNRLDGLRVRGRLGALMCAY